MCTVAKIQEVISVLLNMIEDVIQQNGQLKKTVQSQKNEINKLKGEQGKPTVRPQVGSGNSNHSSDKDRNKRGKKKKRKLRDKKQDVITTTRSVTCDLDTSKLPADAVNKGYKTTVIQDIKITIDNIEFYRQVYYSPS